MKGKYALYFALAPFFGNIASAADNYSETTLLPEEFKVYYLENVSVSNAPFEGATETILPTRNDFKENPGCYIACYSHSEKRSIYPIGKNIYVMGQIRIHGHYENKICKPMGYEKKDISKEKYFKFRCEKAFPDRCKGSECWGGGDTGGWFAPSSPKGSPG